MGNLFFYLLLIFFFVVLPHILKKVQAQQQQQQGQGRTTQGDGYAAPANAIKKYLKSVGAAMDAQRRAEPEEEPEEVEVILAEPVARRPAQPATRREPAARPRQARVARAAVARPAPAKAAALEPVAPLLEQAPARSSGLNLPPMTEMQKAIVLSEILGPPRALK